MKIRFQPVSEFVTESYIDKMLNVYYEGVRSNILPILLIPAVVYDFLFIHLFLM